MAGLQIKIIDTIAIIRIQKGDMPIFLTYRHHVCFLTSVIYQKPV